MIMCDKIDPRPLVVNENENEIRELRSFFICMADVKPFW